MKFWMRISYSEYLRLMIKFANFDLTMTEVPDYLTP